MSKQTMANSNRKSSFFGFEIALIEYFRLFSIMQRQKISNSNPKSSFLALKFTIHFIHMTIESNLRGIAHENIFNGNRLQIINP